MRPEDIFDAVTDIRDDQIEYAVPRRSMRRYLVPLAACIVLAVIAAPFLRARLPGAAPLYTGTARLAAARYPQAGGDETSGPYSDTAGEASTEDGELLEEIEQGRSEYFQNFEAYNERLAPFWADSAETFLTADQEQNLIFSPVSLYTILGMSAELCEGEPQREILELLQSPDIADLRDSARRVWCASFSMEDSSTCLLANSVWLANSVDYKQPVLDTLAENYFADSFRGDMGSAEYDRLHLQWLSEKTNGYLDGILPELETDPSTLMYLDSTLYFKARWDNEFDPADNTEGTFHGTYMEQPCTFMTDTYFSYYYRGRNFTAAYKVLSGMKVMLFVLPDEGTTTNQLLADPEYKRFIKEFPNTPATWEDIGYARITLSVPKFDISSDMEMAAGLKALGINGIFESGTGSFSPITDQDFAFTSVSHTCRVSIDEQGCQASSVIVEAAMGSAGPPEEELDFTLDRPFLFTILSRDSLPIYMGAVNRAAE